MVYIIHSFDTDSLYSMTHYTTAPNYLAAEANARSLYGAGLSDVVQIDLNFNQVDEILEGLQRKVDSLYQTAEENWNVFQQDYYKSLMDQFHHFGRIYDVMETGI